MARPGDKFPDAVRNFHTWVHHITFRPAIVSGAVDGSFSEEPGSGATAIVQQKKVTVGTLSWLARHGIVKNTLPEPEEFKNHSVVYVGADGDLVGHIYFEDKVREEAKQVVTSLVREGIDVYILSGDKRSTADHVASVVGISKDKVISGVRPDEKRSFVRDLQNEGKVVAMVGDGVNDAAALASSNLGIAMGEGVGAASDVADVVLMRSKLSQLLDSMELSRLTMRTIRQNLWWAFAYNIVGIPVAAGALLPFTGTMLTPSIAGALMGLSSVGVMANSLLLRAQLGSKQKPQYKFPESRSLPSLSDALVDIDEPKEKPHAAKSRGT